MKGYVYANDQVLATQQAYVSWRHPNPGSNSWVETSTPRYATRQEMDPIGAETGVSDPYVTDPSPDYLAILYLPIKVKTRRDEISSHSICRFRSSTDAYPYKRRFYGHCGPLQSRNNNRLLPVAPAFPTRSQFGHFSLRTRPCKLLYSLPKQ